MRTVTLLLAGLLVCASLGAAPVPPTPAHQAPAVQAPASAVPAAPMTPAVQPADLAALFQSAGVAQQEVCPLCIIGYHCCFFGPHARCIPETRACPS